MRKGEKMSLEQKMKIGKANKGRKFSEEIISKRRGRILSDTHRLNLSKALKGRKLSDITRNRISNSLKGGKRNQETINKMRLAHLGKPSKNKGKPRPEWVKLKISQSEKGKQVSVETRQKLSKALKGKKLSIEVRTAMSIRRKGIKRTDLSKEARWNIGKTFRGKSWNKGKHPSIESRIKMSLNNGQRGSKCHWWKGGVTPINKSIRKGLDFKLWREFVFKRDNYTCQKCKRKNGNGEKIILNPHHIENFSTCIEKRFDINNGVTLCDKCHQKFHSLYGRHNNNLQQLNEFLNL